MLRDYQIRSINMLYDEMRQRDGNPCLVLPTGAGKSHIIAALCKDALNNWPNTRFLMLTHQKELIEQNAEKLLLHWPNAPLGIYSASVGKKRLGEPITFAGIQSIIKKIDCVGFIDVVLIDECHLISHKDEGSYRKVINYLFLKNPQLKVIGLTATPYRLGHGLIIDKPALFDYIVEPVSIDELIYKKFLSPLKSKLTSFSYDVSKVHKRGGEYIEEELQRTVNTFENNEQVVSEVISLAGERLSWLFFCSGVNHALSIRDIVRNRGISCECITGFTPRKEREDIIRSYKNKEIRALTNANVLTTGFDYPDIDLIVMLRPTMSPALYVQMAGRGLRLKSHTDHCLVLDFAGVVRTHGPITNVTPPKKKGGSGEAPVKVCDECHEIVHLSAKICPSCGSEFESIGNDKDKIKLHNHDIMGSSPLEMKVKSWRWSKHISKTSGLPMLKVYYYSSLTEKPVKEYFTIMHEGYAGKKSLSLLSEIANNSNCNDIFISDDLDVMSKLLSKSNPPAEITYKMDGKFHKIIDRRWI